MRAALIALCATSLTACETTRPYENFLEWEPAAYLGDTVMRTPDDRLCAFTIATYSQGRLLMPGFLACDNDDRKLVHVLAPQDGVSLKQVEAPVTPAILSSSAVLYRFDPDSAELKSGPAPAVAPAAFDSKGRPIYATPRLYRVEGDGSQTTLLGSAPQGLLRVAPDDRLFVETISGDVRIAEVVNQSLQPVLRCPDAGFSDGCRSVTLLGFDGEGRLYAGAFVASASAYLFARIDPDRSLHMLPAGPSPAQPGWAPTCSVTRSGRLVCMYHFGEKDDEQEHYSPHIELVELGAGDSSWNRIGMGPSGGNDLSPVYIVARDGGDVLAGAGAGGLSGKLELSTYHY